MTSRRFERRLHGEVDLDLCFSCQGIWFDEFESLQITPGAIIDLFKLIHEHRDAQRAQLAAFVCCPRCDERLLHAMDSVKSGRFNYYRCLQNHGRFTTFGQFMIEKGFVRQLSKAEIGELQARVDVVRCPSCGAPVDIRSESACGHCRSPVAILDTEAVEQALAGYQQAEVKRTAMSPDTLAEAILARERLRSDWLREEKSPLNRPVHDLLIDGVEAVWNLLRR